MFIYLRTKILRSRTLNVIVNVICQKSLVDCNSYNSFNDRKVSNKRCQLDIFIIRKTGVTFKGMEKVLTSVGKYNVR